MKYTAKQLREMPEHQLNKILEDSQGELRQLRFLAGQGELKQVHKIRNLKKMIAQILTIRNQGEVAVAAPTAEDVSKKDDLTKKEKSA